MAENLPPTLVTIRDVTLREFGQNVPRAAIHEFSIHRRLWLARKLVDAGFTTLEVASTASPKVAPAMASELLEPYLGKLGKPSGVELITLVPGRRAYQRFLKLGLGPEGLDHTVGVFFSAMDEHNRANLRKSVDESLEELASFVPKARRRGMSVVGYVSAAFGFVTPLGEHIVAPKECVIEHVQRLEDLGVESVTLSDLQGLAGPEATAELLGSLLTGSTKCSVPIGYHPHHQRSEVALDNVVAAAQVGVKLFDASLGAVGGCVTGAPGNAPTEGVVRRLESVGFRTNLNADVLDGLSNDTKRKLYLPVIQYDL